MQCPLCKGAGMIYAYRKSDGSEAPFRCNECDRWKALCGMAQLMLWNKEWAKTYDTKRPQDQTYTET